jgi:uncharacterized membrane protein
MMIHPATAHFAMVLPVVASAFGIAYMISRTETMSKILARTTLVAALAMIAAWYTGNQAGPQIFDYLSQAGKHELLEHKELGLYLAIAMGIIALLQIIGCKMKKFGIQVFATLLLIAAMFTTFLQGKHGGEIVYNYGMPFKAYMMQDSLNEAVKTADATEDDSEKVEAYEDAIDDISTVSEEVDAIYGNKPAPEDDEEDE